MSFEDERKAIGMEEQFVGFAKTAYYRARFALNNLLGEPKIVWIVLGVTLIFSFMMLTSLNSGYLTSGYVIEKEFIPASSSATSEIYYYSYDEYRLKICSEKTDQDIITIRVDESECAWITTTVDVFESLEKGDFVEDATALAGYDGMRPYGVSTK